MSTYTDILAVSTFVDKSNMSTNDDTVSHHGAVDSRSGDLETEAPGMSLAVRLSRRDDHEQRGRLN